MRLLVLSFYYNPDLSAGSFRTTALVRELRQLPGVEIDVVTTLPNRYSSFSNEAKSKEQDENVSITRIMTPAHSSDMLGQSRAFLCYARETLRATKDSRYDIVFATSSRLMTAALGAWVSRRKRIPLYLDIRDIFVDTIRDITAAPIAFLAGSFFSMVERWTINRANTVNLVSRGFEPYFKARYPDHQYAWFTNGIDDEFIEASSAIVPATTKRDTVSILYAGNIGEGQCLHDIVPGLAKSLGSHVEVTIIGDGGRRKQLQDAIDETGVSNVRILPPVVRSELIDLYRSTDILFLHLGDYDAFKKVLPSKLFEYGAMGKPILAGVSGYAAEFVEQEISNSAVFPPGDVPAATVAYSRLRLRDEPRHDFLQKFSREQLSAAMALDIVSVAGHEA